MEIAVIVERVVFRNDTGFAVLAVNLDPYSNKYNEEIKKVVSPYVNKKYGTFTITIGMMEPGEDPLGGQYVFVGEFIEDKKFSKQFKAEFYYQDIPGTEEGLRIFLMSLPNIKQSRSEAILKKFGLQGAIDILDNNPNRLTEINGITTGRVPAIKKSWDDRKWLRELYQWFMSVGWAAKLADAAYKKWGKATKSTLEENPYRLVELRGIGFVTADKMAHILFENEKKPIKEDFRVTACIHYLLNEDVYKNSNLCMSYTNLKKHVLGLLSECNEALDKDTDPQEILKLIPECLKGNLKLFTLVKDLKENTAYVYLREIWHKELFVVSSLYKRLIAEKDGKECNIHDLDRAEKNVSEFNKCEIKLDETQRLAIQSAFQHKISIITGPGGSGKSMICRCIFALAQEKGLKIRMMSPTGKAAQVLTTKTGSTATTIHRGLRMKPGDDMPKETIDEDILLVDEISMCGLDTMYALIQALRGNAWANIIFVGDKNQLPSVSPGNFLSDIIESGCANVVTLDKIHRQSEDSYISLMANAISKGKVVMVPEKAKDMKWHDLSVNTFHDDILIFIDKFLADGHTIDELQIIAPMKKGPCGVYKLNEVIQKKMSEINHSVGDCLERGFSKLYIGDRVMQVENNYEKMVFNGDMGVITALGDTIKDPSASDKKEKFVKVNMYGEEVSYFGEEIEELHLAWCITVHKFQGSQSPYVVFVMANEHQVMMSKELVYTAFTRAEKQLDIFGNDNMLRMAPTRSVIRKRYTSFCKIIDQLKNNEQVLQVIGLKEAKDEKPK